MLAYLLAALAVTFVCHRWIRRIAAGAAIVLIALPMLVTGPALVTNQVYGGFDLLFLVQPFSDYAGEHGFRGAHSRLLVDHVMQMAPWQRQVRETWSRGEWPLWNPSMNSGDILAATMQPAPYSPLNLLALLLPLDLATTFTATMILFLSALFTYLFTRELGCSEGASLIAAAGYTLSGAVLFWAGWSHLGGSWSLLPFVLLATRRGTFALLTIALTLLVLFGHPESMLHVVAIGVAYGVFQRPSLRKVGIALGAGVVALLITAIFLLPFLATLDDSLEYLERRSWTRPVPAINVDSIRATFVLRSTLQTSGQWGEWNEQGARVGSVILALAFVAALRLWRLREVRFFTVLAIVALLASWNAPPVAQLLRALPLFDIALNERLAFGAALALSLLAAFAFDARGGRLIAVIVAAILAVLTATAWLGHWATDVNPRMLVAGALAELLGIALLLIALSTRSPRVALALILAAIAAQRVVEDGKMYPTMPRSAFYPRTPLVDAIPRDPLYRAIGVDTILIPNVASMYGLDDIRAYTTMNHLRYMETRPLWSGMTRHYHNVLDLSRPFLSFLGVRHAIAPRSMEPPPGWRVVADDRTCRLLENTRPLPRVFVPRNLRWIDVSSGAAGSQPADAERWAESPPLHSMKTAMQEMGVATDFADTAWIYTRDLPTQTVDNGEAALQVRRVGSRYEIDADVRSGCRIVISEVAWPGWRAYLDGRRVKIDRANHAFLAVYLPAGKHHVRVVYLPDAFVRGRAISFATLALLAVVAAGRRLLRRPRVPPEDRMSERQIFHATRVSPPHVIRAVRRGSARSAS